MNAFEQAVKAMWRCKDFLETAIVDGEVVDVVCSSIKDEIAWGEAGAENPASFVLYVQTSAIKKPNINDKVVFRDETYKISYIELDSADTSYKLYLVEMSTGIK